MPKPTLRPIPTGGGRRTAAAVALVLPGWLAAPGHAAGGALTWDDCLAAARARNPDLVRARHRLDAAGARHRAAFGGYLPRLNASLSGSDSDRNNRLWFADPEPSWSARLTASQSLFAGFATYADVLRTGASVRRAAASLRQTEADLRARLRRLFVDVLFGQEQVRVQRMIAERRAGNADLVRLRYESGREDKGSSLQAAADAQQAAAQARAAERALALARGRLAREIGRETGAPLTVTGSWDTPPPPADPDLAALAAATPAVAQAEADEAEARAAVLSARAPLWPSLDALAGVGRDGGDWPPGPDRSWNASLTLSLSVFNGWRDRHAIAAARAAAQEAAEALAAARRDAELALQEALNAWRDAHEAREVRAAFLEAARTRAEIARARYANGRLGFVEWDLIEGQLVNEERAYLSARQAVLSAEAGWRRALGEGLVP